MFNHSASRLVVLLIWTRPMAAFNRKSSKCFLCWTQPLGASRSGTAHWELSKLLHLIGL